MKNILKLKLAFHILFIVIISLISLSSSLYAFFTKNNSFIENNLFQLNKLLSVILVIQILLLISSSIYFFAKREPSKATFRIVLICFIIIISYFLFGLLLGLIAISTDG